MTQILWDQVGERDFEAGLDRGVLYLPEGGAVAWNGLTSVDEKPGDQSTPYYLDGIKYLDAESIGDFAATLKAFTYPDAFEPFIGVGSVGNGLLVGDQPNKRFNLSYRTRKGNDTNGVDHGYEIHILYNITAIPDASAYQTIGAQITPLEFAWVLTAIPEPVENHRPTAHLVLDSTELDPDILEALESMLYGTEEVDPNLPSLQEFRDLMVSWASITIVDNGDGTWSATSVGPDAEEYIEMLNATTFQISNVDAVFLDDDTYEISSTVPDD